MPTAELSRLGQSLSRLEGRADTLKQQLGEARAAAYQQAAEADECAKVLAVLRGLEAAWRERIEGGIASIISHGLSVVFGEPIEVVLETTTFRDTTSMEILIRQNGALSSVLDAKGGSLVQVLGFLWRLFLTVTAQPPLARVLVLDEPFAMVSEEYRPALAELLRELSTRLGVQFLIITHEKELTDAADVAYEVVWYNNAARLHTIKNASEEASL